jgi:cation diffusion facilitator CzcD-associated flavoprotein CzcO
LRIVANNPKSCIIGAGPSGLTVGKALKDRGLPYDCFDRSDNVGGNWYFNNPNGLSSAYRMLHIDSSKLRSQFAEYPMPEEYPHFPHHSQIWQYFRDYAEHFGLLDGITFRTTVEHCRRDDDGIWHVQLENGETRCYDALFVCNGHHWNPRLPEPPFPGNFTGRVLHSHDYKDAADFRDQRVVVLGIGNSAMDISVECSYVAKKVYLATRRGAHVSPKYVWGRPLDHWNQPWVPWWLMSLTARFMVWMQVGRYENNGLPKPDHRMLQAHPSVSTAVYDRLAHGDITVKPNIARFDGDQVHFVDGSQVEADAVIYCTGYKVSFPFFDPDFVSAPDNDLPLYLRMIKPGVPNLFFIGLCQPLGAIFPIAERQAVLCGEYLAGRYRLPDESEMNAEMDREREVMFRRYVKSKRHTMQVDFTPFMKRLDKEIKLGAKRVKTHGAGSAIPVRADRKAVPTA